MKMSVDSAQCQGYGVCAEEAPDLVELDEFGYSSVVGDGTVPPDEEAVARVAADSCPVQAIRLH